jgi:hypothetical protein
MTPQEKADDLVQEMYAVLSNSPSDISYYFSKHCARVAVDEILSMGIMSHSGDWQMAKSYWEEVKQEIEKL